MGNQGAILLASLLVFLSPSSSLQETTLLFLNDLQYDFFPVDAAGTQDPKPVCTDDLKEDTNCVGGLARLMTLLNDSITEDLLWMNAGNFLGGPNYELLKFQTAAKALNFLKFHASAVGPELFRYGLEPSETYFNAMGENTVLASNWHENNAVKNSTMIGLSKECHVAVVGFMNKEKVDEMKVFGVSIEDEKTAIEREVAAIKSANADKKILYVALGSASIEKAQAIASIQDIDLVVFSGGNFSATEKPEEHPFLQPVKAANKTKWIASVNRNFKGVDSRFLIGQLNFTLNEECKIAGDPVLSVLEYMISKKAPDEKLSDFLHTEAGKIAAVKDVVAVTKVSLLPTSDACITGECSLGDFIADAMVAKLNALNETLPWTESVKLAVLPGGIIRNVENTTGPVTSETLYKFFDQDEFIYTITLTGAQIKKLFETSVKEYKSSKTPMKDYLQVSGSLCVEFDDKKVASLRSVSETSNSLALTVVNLSDTTSTYKVAVPAFMLHSSDSYKFLMEVGQPTLNDATVVDALRAMVGGGLRDNFLSLPATGHRLLRVKKSPQSADCANTTGEAVILTLTVVVALIAAGLLVWKVLLPKYRTRRGSATHLLP